MRDLANEFWLTELRYELLSVICNLSDDTHYTNEDAIKDLMNIHDNLLNC